MSRVVLPSALPQPVVPTSTPIEHVVVIFEENQSFDHYFGTYPEAKNIMGESPFHAAVGTPTVNGLSESLRTNKGLLLKLRTEADHCREADGHALSAPFSCRSRPYKSSEEQPRPPARVAAPRRCSPIHINDPRSGLTYFDTSAFSPEQLGQLGNAPRRFFHGPGIDSFDMALLKNTQLRENLDLQFRAEFFNVFNHTQFLGVNGNVNSPTFGQVQSAQQPRIGQLSIKLNF